MAEFEYDKVIPTSGNQTNGTAHSKIDGPQFGPQNGSQFGPQYGSQYGSQPNPQDYEVPSINLQLQSSTVEEPVYEGIS